jgi:PAS domain S-box-containing protein
MSEKTTQDHSLREASGAEQSASYTKDALERLRESEQLFRSLTETSFAVAFIAQDGVFRYINASAIAYAGYTAEELIGRNADIIVHPDDRAMVKMKAREMLKGRNTSPYEFRMITKQGKIRLIIQIVSSIQYHGRPAILGNAMDVTERKQAEEALRESERRLADIIDFLPDATLAIDLQGRVIAWNRAIEEMTGVKAQDMLGKGDYEYALPFYGVRRPILSDLVLKPDKKVEKSYYSILEKKKDLLIVETWVPFLKWRRAFLWAKASPLYDSKGDIAGAIEPIRDITERKQLEELLRMSEEKYRQLFATVPDAIFIFDAETRQFIDANESALKLYSYSREEFLKMKLADITAEPEESEKVVKKTMAAKMDIVPLRYHIKQDKTVFPVEASTSMYNLESRKVICVVIRDITDRNRGEEAIRESEERHRTLFERTANPILVIDTDGNYVACNQAALQFFQCTQHEILSKNVRDFAPPNQEQQTVEMQKSLWEFGGSVEIEYDIQGELKFMELTITPTVWQGKDVILGVGKDITKRKQAEAVLERREMELEAKTNELEDLNAALRVLLKQREEDRNELEQKVLSNVKLLILPHIEKLKNHLDVKGMAYVNVIESNLKDIISPFAQKLSVKYLNLTNREVQVANLIKEGKTTKEIATFLNVSDSAVNVYRYHIRRKLNLTKKHNLRSYVSSLIN